MKGVQTLSLEEQLAADTMQALKASKKSSRSQPLAGGSSEGTDTKSGVRGESTGILYTLSEGTGAKPGVPDKEKVTSAAIADVILDWGSEQESEYSEEDQEQVNDDEDEEMTDAKVVVFNKGDEEITDTAKENAEKTKEVKDDTKKTEFPPSSSSVSVSSGTHPLHYTETTGVAPATTLLPLPHYVSTISHVLLQTTTLIPTPPITIEAPPVTIIPYPLPAIIKRVFVLEKDVQEINEVDHNTTLLASLRPETPSSSTVKNALEKTLLLVAQSSSQAQSSLQAAESLSEYELKTILFEKMDKSHSYLNHGKLQALFDALLNSISLDDVIARCQADPEKVLRKRDRDDKNPSVRPNQGQKTKRSKTKESEPSKKSSTSKESFKGKSHAKTSKSGKSVTTEELVFEMACDDIEQNVDDVNHQMTQLKLRIKLQRKIGSNILQGLLLLIKIEQASSRPGRLTVAAEYFFNNDLEFLKSSKYWFKQPPRPPTPDPKWNKRQVVDDHHEQPWFNNMVSATKDPLTFDELMANPIDFSKYAMNRLKIDKLTKAHLVRPVYNLLKGTCQSSIELEYNMEECYKSLFDQLDWNNPEGDLCPFDLNKPLMLKGRPCRLTVPLEYFFNNDLEYLKSPDPKKKYTMSIMKTKAAIYELVGIEDMIPNLWSDTKVGYDKDAAFGIKHWGPKRQQFFIAQLNRFSKHNVYSTQKILSVVSVKINKLHGYGHFEEIVVRKVDRQLYKFKEGDFVDLHLNDIKDMLLLAVQHRLFQLNGSDIVDFVVALRMFTKSLIIKRRVENVQLGVESYQKKLNLTKPQQDFPRISAKDLELSMKT
ncbi:hypothetical protein Tco_0388822 [Tanacetum coccineum]